jgi:hypothetical protein
LECRYVRKHAATCIREVAKHTPELAQLIVSNGGVGALVDYVVESEGNNRLPGVMTLGFIAAFSETLALSVIASKGVVPLYTSLVEEPEDHIKSASAWALGQVGRHSPDHAKALADANVLPKLVATLVAPESSDDLKTKCKRSLKFITEKLTDMKALDKLLQVCVCVCVRARCAPLISLSLTRAVSLPAAATHAYLFAEVMC